jgi:LPS sulfotransferase NodH
MKRDPDLIRKMILQIEDAPSGWAPHLAIEGYAPAQVSYHAYLIVDAGLARGRNVTTMGSDGPEAMITSLTWAGHEFAEAAREETRWRKAMGIVKEKGGSITLDVLTQLLGSLMRGAFGLP